MKKVKIIAFLLMFSLLISGCGVELATWQKESEVGGGVYVILADKRDENLDWYATVDLATSSVLSVNLIYPEKYGEPTEKICTADGEKTSCTLQTGEQDGKRIAFFTLPASISSFDSKKEILITVKFGRKKVKFKFIPQMIGEAAVSE